jgi:hypothetical protein
MGKPRRGNVKRLTVDIDTDIKNTTAAISMASGLDICIIVEGCLSGWNKKYLASHPENVEMIEKLKRIN